MLKDRESTVPSTATVKDAIERMGEQAVPALAVITGDKLVGLFTNGDMRKYFLRGGDLSAPITDAMNPHPVCFRSQGEIAQARAKHPYIVYPLLNDEGGLQAMVFGEETELISRQGLKGVPLVVMAGGKGTRLYPYTRILPKALVPVGDKSISERIIEQFYARGCRDVWFILNHKAEMIKAYFDSIDHDYCVHYCVEHEFRGTGGGLDLVRNNIHSTFILSNCDILIEDDLTCAYRTHKKRGDDITYVCAILNHTIPYGVIETSDEGLVTSVTEKPSMSYMVSTGVYIVEPHVLDYIREDECLDFPDIVKRCQEAGGKVGVFPVPESAWIDIGELAKMKLAAKRLGGGDSASE